MSPAEILRGPHLKSLTQDGTTPILVIEPLAFVPVRNSTITDHGASPQGRRAATGLGSLHSYGSVADSFGASA